MACVADLQRDAAEVARKRCAEHGLQLIQTDLIDKGGVFGIAGVVGECVGLDDPRFVKSYEIRFPPLADTQTFTRAGRLWSPLSTAGEAVMLGAHGAMKAFEGEWL